MHFANVDLGRPRYAPDPTGYRPTIFVEPLRPQPTGGSTDPKERSAAPK